MEAMALDVAQGLSARGHDVHVLVSAWNDGEFIRRLTAAGLKHGIVPFGKFTKAFRLQTLQYAFDNIRHVPHARRVLRAHLDQFRPDAVILYNRDWVLQARSLLRGHRTVFHVEELPTRTRLAKWIYASLGRSTKLFIAASKYVASELERLNVSPAKIRVVYNGVDGPDKIEARENGHPLTIGVVGQVGAWKGHEDLFNALGVLFANGRKFRCSVFGDGDAHYVAELKELAKRQGIDDLIDWHGYVREKEVIYGHIDICAFPSRIDEAFGLGVIEAGLRSIPVVATRRGALPELVVHGETGLLVESGCAPALAESLDRLLCNADLRRQLGTAARARAMSLFTVSQMVAGIERQCESLIGPA
jgi:glycosyltransferase involved in cell wall biosynthesis